MDLYIFGVLLLCLVSTTLACECENGGTCIDEGGNCQCKGGFYGPICSNYADSYKVTFATTPTAAIDVEGNLAKSLSKHRINKTVQIHPGNVYKLMFYKKLSVADRDDISRTILEVIKLNFVQNTKDIEDFNECEDGAGAGKQTCYDGKKCANTIGSFTCGCSDGYSIDEKTVMCVKQADKTKTVIYIWAAVVAAVILVMIAFIIFYRWKKIDKGKKIQREMEKKAAHQSSLTPTNLDDFDTFRRSPNGSIFDGPISTFGRPMSAVYNPDGTSLYSYNSRMYSQSEPDYTKRLSAPVLENYAYENGGYGDDGMGPPPGALGQYGSPTRYARGSSEPGLSGIQEDRISAYSGGRGSAVIPTSFPSDLELVREDRYEGY